MRAEILAHRIASEAVRWEKRHRRPLGRDSLYNFIREVAAEVLEQELPPTCDCQAFHLLDCPAHGTGERTHLKTRKLIR